VFNSRIEKKKKKSPGRIERAKSHLIKIKIKEREEEREAARHHQQWTL
jgi:hypothetical protein